MLNIIRLVLNYITSKETCCFCRSKVSKFILKLCIVYVIKVVYYDKLDRLVLKPTRRLNCDGTYDGNSVHCDVNETVSGSTGETHVSFSSFKNKCFGATGLWKRAYPEHIYCKTSSISRTKSQSLNDSCILLQLSSLNPLKPGVKLRMKM